MQNKKKIYIFKCKTGKIEEGQRANRIIRINHIKYLRIRVQKTIKSEEND